jgi:hypothetical protein
MEDENNIKEAFRSFDLKAFYFYNYQLNVLPGKRYRNKPESNLTY